MNTKSRHWHMLCKKGILEIWAKLLKNTCKRIQVFKICYCFLEFQINFTNFSENLSVGASKARKDVSQTVFTCSKSTVETTEERVKYIQS